MENIRNFTLCLIGNSVEKRLLGRLRRSWEGDVNVGLTESDINVIILDGVISREFIGVYF